MHAATLPSRLRPRLVRALVLAVLLAIPAQAATAAPLELERGRLAGAQIRVVVDRAASGGHAVSMTGRAVVRRRVASGAAADLLLHARGVPCAGAPRVGLLVDGRAAGSRRVRSRRFAWYRLPVRLRRGRRLVTLRFANPRRTRACRRRLVLDALELRERAPPPPPPVPPPPATPATPPPAPPATPVGGYRNPVFATPGAPDPMVLDAGGSHSDYFAFTTGDRFPVLRSSDLVHWAAAGTAMQARPAWAAQHGDWNPWAPSVIERVGACPGAAGDRCFVLFYVSRHGSLSPETNCVGVATSPTPAGPYSDRGPLAYAAGGLDLSGRPPGCGDDAGYSNIDPAPFLDADGRAYLYLSTTRRCEIPTPGASCPAGRTISVLPLSGDLLTAAGARQPLFGADPGGWEQAPWAPVVENPWPQRRGASYFLFYSGGSYAGPYGGGYATSSSPIGPFTKAVENPILREANGVLSVGGATIATGPRGGEWLVYHGREGGYANPRTLRIDPLGWPAEGSVAVGGPTSAPQPVSP